MASGTDIPLLSFPETDPVLPRSLSFFGRAAESVTSALTATSIVAAPHRGDRSFRLTSPLTRFPPQAVVSGSPAASVRPMLTPSGLMVVPSGSLSEAVRISETDLRDAVAFAGGSQRGTKQLAILSATVSGWRPGQTVEVRQGIVSFRGIILSRGVDADTATGSWKSEMIVELI